MGLRHPLGAALRRLAQPYWRLTRAHTLGVRAVVRDADGRVLLVRHTYVPGWHFPGGGVGAGETLEQALARELAEEAGVRIEGRARLFGIYANFDHFPRDHVALYVVGRWSRAPARRGLEIAEARFFSGDALPEETSAATRRRLAEIGDGAEPSSRW